MTVGSDAGGFFERLGTRVERAWAKSGFDDAKFAAIAESALLEQPPAASVTLESIINWVVGRPSLGVQPNADSTFGEPPLTLFAGRRFYIEALVWMDGSTTIHQHGFDGAFCVLAGGSIHSTYEFIEAGGFSSRLRLGQVRFRSAEWLQAGTVRRIDAGSRLIHGLYHLERPSVSVVVRTNHTLGSPPQYTFHPPNVAEYPFDKDLWNKRVEQYLQIAAATLVVKDVAALARAAIAGADDIGAWRILASLSVLFAETRGEDSEAVASTGADARVEAMYRATVDALRDKLGAEAEPLIVSALRSAERNQVSLLRSKIHIEGHRMLLALVTNVPSRKQILEIVRELHPGSDPAERVIAWVRELTSDPAQSVGYVLAADALLLVEHAIRGASFGQMVEAIAGRVGRTPSTEEVEAIRASLSELAELPLLRSLMDDVDSGAGPGRV